MSNVATGASPVRARKIVPVISPAEMAAPIGAPAAHLVYHGGPLLQNVQVQAIFWGDAWNQAAQAPLIPKLESFYKFILSSSLIDMLGEYSVPGKSIGHGTFLGSVKTSTPHLGHSVTDAQIQHALQGWISAHTVAAPNANTLYFIYLPPGVVSHLQGSSSCAAGGFCGYHSHVGSAFYAVEPFITCPGCTFGSGILDSLTKVSSHELCEAITDPMGDGWFDASSGDEIGDICNRGVATLGGFLIQTEFSNAKNACVIAP